jgi:hypothetical protein
MVSLLRNFSPVGLAQDIVVSDKDGGVDEAKPFGLDARERRLDVPWK